MLGKALRYLLPLAIFLAIAFFLWRGLALTITDYKSGANVEKLCSKAKTGLAPQLPLEAAMAAAGAFGPEAAGEAADAGEGTDFHAAANGYVSVTPLQIDLTHREELRPVAAWFGGKPPGLAIATLASVEGLVLDLVGVKDIPAHVHAWDAAIRFGFFAITALWDKLSQWLG